MEGCTLFKVHWCLYSWLFFMFIVTESSFHVSSFLDPCIIDSLFLDPLIFTLVICDLIESLICTCILTVKSEMNTYIYNSASSKSVSLIPWAQCSRSLHKGREKPVTRIWCLMWGLQWQDTLLVHTELPPSSSQLYDPNVNCEVSCFSLETGSNLSTLSKLANSMTTQQWDATIYVCMSRKGLEMRTLPKNSTGYWGSVGTCFKDRLVWEGLIPRRKCSKERLVQEGLVLRRETRTSWEGCMSIEKTELTPDPARRPRHKRKKESDILLIGWALKLSDNNYCAQDTEWLRYCSSSHCWTPE